MMIRLRGQEPKQRRLRSGSLALRITRTRKRRRCSSHSERNAGPFAVADSWHTVDHFLCVFLYSGAILRSDAGWRMAR